MLYALVAIAVLIGGALAYAATAARPFPPRAIDADRGAAGAYPAAHCRLPAMAALVALGGEGPVHDADLVRRRERRRRGLGWSGNGKVGTGRMEILSAEPRAVAMQLDFLKPFEAHNRADSRSSRS